MRKLLLLFLLLPLIVTSCKQKVSPIAYNDQLVGYLTNADKNLEILDEKIDIFFESEEFSPEILAQLNNEIKATKDSIQIDLEKVKVLEKAEGADNFHNATIVYLESLVAHMDIYKEQYSKISNNTSDEEYAKMDEVISNSFTNIDAKFEDLLKAQSEFAKASNTDLIMYAPITSSVIE